MKKKLLDLIKKKKPGLLQGKDETALTVPELETLARMAELSLDDIRDLLRQAVRERFKSTRTGANNEPIEDSLYLQEVYPAYLIYELQSKYFKVSWSMLDGKVTLGETPVEVAQTWVETENPATIIMTGMDAIDGEYPMIVRMAAARNPEGTEWEAVICAPGFTKNGFYMDDKMLGMAETVAAFEGLDVNLYELPQGATHVPAPLFDLKALLVKNKCGWLDNVRYVAGQGLVGIVHFLESAKQLGKNMLAAMSQGRSVYGLSWDARIRGIQTTIEGKSVIRIDGFNRADSLDLVSRPAAGGKFIRAVAGLPLAQKEEDSMKKLLALIKQKRPDLLTGKDEAALTDQEIEVIAQMAMEPPKTDPTDEKIDPSKIVTKDELEIMRCGMALNTKLADTNLGLPQIAIDRVKKQFEGRAFASADLDAAIAGEKEYLAKISQSAQAQGVVVVGAGTISGGLGSFERACMAADRLFGLKKEDVVNMAELTRLDNKPFFADIRSTQDLGDYDKVPAFTSIREMYTYFTGDAEVSGRFNRKALAPELRASMDINSATFSFVVGNTLARRLVGTYKAMAYLEELLISIKKPVKDFRTQEAVLVGGFPDLSTVDPEAADYQEIAGVTDEESTYAIGQKGNILTITRKMIVNDDITIIQRLIDGLARAARRTHAKYVWALFTANANCSDGTAWFTAPHANLGATALSHATALIAYKALASMTEKDSGERLGLLSDPGVKVNLVGPIDLMETIDKIANEEFYYTANDLTTKVPNPLRGKVNGVSVPLLTDASDWGMLLPPNIIDMVEMGYLNGREEPELFVADMPQSEQVFVADKIRHKIRHEYAGAVIDFRSGYKAEVA